MLAIDDYDKKTHIRFKEYNNLTNLDYIHITGENGGCWSNVGRIGGVSKIVQGVVKPITANRTARVL